MRAGQGAEESYFDPTPFTLPFIASLSLFFVPCSMYEYLSTEFSESLLSLNTCTLVWDSFVLKKL